MSLFRPEALALLRRWGEPALALAVLVLAGWWGVPEALSGAVLGWFALGAAVLALFWLRAALLAALAARPATGTGAVMIREREIGYLGPFRGGFLELDDIVRVEIYYVPGGTDPVWRLVGSAGQALAIPANAEGAGHLPEALEALPGFSDLTAMGVLQRPRPGRHLVWERAAPPLLSRPPRLD